MRRLKKKIFLGLFGGTVALLGLVRLAFPEVTGGEEAEPTLPVEEPVPPRENSSTTTVVLASRLVMCINGKRWLLQPSVPSNEKGVV